MTPPQGTERKDSYRIVIAGGGVIGLSLAYHLGKLGLSDCLLLERNRLASGTSWHAAGIVGPLRASLNLTRLSHYATELFAALEAETGQATGYRRTGGLWLAQSQDRLTELRRIAALGDISGLEARILSAEEAHAAFPLMRHEDLAGALWVTEDGQTNPVDTCMAYAKGARQAGVSLVEGEAVTGVETEKGAVRAVTTSRGRRISCDVFVNCAGLWARDLGALSGVAVPLQAAEHMYIVTEALDGLPNPCPIVRDLDSHIYLKEDAGRLVLGGFEEEAAKPWDPVSVAPDADFLELPDDWDQFEPFLTAGLRRIPALETLGIQRLMNGPESFTPDTRQLLGEAPNLRNYFVAAGFNSIGIVSSAGAGKALAEWIRDGQAPMDLWEVDVARFATHDADLSFLRERVTEAVGNQFAMHWPFKQMKTGRNRRVTPLHEGFAAVGAVFGNAAGWERPFWFAGSPEESRFRYSYGEQHWWPCAAREARALKEGVALFELSPFSKFEVEGADASSALQQMVTADLDVEEGKLVYGQMLNDRGGIEADITILRLAPDRFRIIGGAPTRWRDLAWLRRHLGERDLTIRDVTEDFAVLGVMGPKSRDLLAALGPSDLESNSFAFATAQEIELAGITLLAARISFVGELGWELYIPREKASALFKALLAEGRDFGLTPAGHLCFDACRLEKGFRHWGHDMGPEDTPLEVGLGVTLAWDKPGGFIGRDALLAQRAEGLARRLLHFRIAEGHPLLLHDEPLYRDGRLIGHTTSGARGFRCDASLCFATFALEKGETRAQSLAAAYEVKIAGQRHTAIPLTRPPYDPDGRLMRT